MARRRGFESARDMVLSLGVVLGFVALIVLLAFRQTPDPVTVVDAAPVLQAVQYNAPYAAVAPRPIEGWRVTSARVSIPGATPFRWHVGYYTSSGTYAAVGQSDGAAAAYLNDEVAGGRTVGSVTVDGVRWTSIERDDGRRKSLVRTVDGVTTLVTGTGGVDELTKLAGSLRPVKGTPATPLAASVSSP